MPTSDSKPARTTLRKPTRLTRPAPSQPPVSSVAGPKLQAAAPQAPTRRPSTAAPTPFTQISAPTSSKKPRFRKPRKDPALVTSAPVSPLVESGERLSKRVMQLKACSRKEAEQFISGGWVQVNGVVVEEPAHRVDQQTVTVDPQASLLNLSSVTLLLNKPAGATDGLDDPEDDDDNDDAGIDQRKVRSLARVPVRAAAPRHPPRKAPPNARSLLTPQHRWEHDASGIKLLKRHLQDLQGDMELETGATGLVVFTQDWRTARKLSQDMAVMEQEYLVEVRGEVAPEALKPIDYALTDERNNLPQVKVSVNSSTPEMSRIRFAIKGAHPGLVAHLCAIAGFTILAMRRIRLGRVTLADLPVGQWRYLADYEKF